MLKIIIWSLGNKNPINITTLIFPYFNKASDTVNFNVLYTKLIYYGNGTLFYHSYVLIALEIYQLYKLLFCLFF